MKREIEGFCAGRVSGAEFAQAYHVIFKCGFPVLGNLQYGDSMTISWQDENEHYCSNVPPQHRIYRTHNGWWVAWRQLQEWELRITHCPYCGVTLGKHATSEIDLRRTPFGTWHMWHDGIPHGLSYHPDCGGRLP